VIGDGDTVRVSREVVEDVGRTAEGRLGVDHPCLPIVKRPGPYQLRVALRDVIADRIGSASQFVDVPDVKKGRLTLSGLVIGTAPPVIGSINDQTLDATDPAPTQGIQTPGRGRCSSSMSRLRVTRRQFSRRTRPSCRTEADRCD
jgi:hypothetical protein